MEKVLYLLLPPFAEHELPFLSQPLRSDAVAMKENPQYENKIVAPSMEPVEAISGFRLLPDYTFETIPDEYAALVLIGGYGWQSEAAHHVTPLVADALSKGRIVPPCLAETPICIYSSFIIIINDLRCQKSSCRVCTIFRNPHKE